MENDVSFWIPIKHWMRVPVAPHPHQYLVLSVFWILAILIGLTCNLWCWTSFHLIIWHLYVFFGKVLFLWPIFNPVVHFLICWVLRVLCTSCIHDFYQIHILQMFYPNMWLVVSLYWSWYIFYRVYSKRRTSLVSQTIVCLKCRRPGLYLWVGKIPWKWKWQHTPVFLSGKPHGQRSLAGYSSWGCKESDIT